MSEHLTITHERTDAIPVILAFLPQRRVAEVIDKHLPPPGHWTGLSLGQMLSVWWTCLLAAGAHRRSHVEPWSAAPQRTRRRWVHQPVLPRDGAAARLARGREAWGGVATGGAGARHQRRRRGDELPPHPV